MQDASDDAALVAACRSVAGVAAVDPEGLAAAARRHARDLWQNHALASYCASIGISSTEGMWARFTGEDPRLAHLRAWAPEYRREVWRRALAEYGWCDTALAAALAEAFIRERRARHVVFAETDAVLRRLQGRYRLGMVTNGAPDLQREKIEGARLAPYFDAIVISGDVGVGKPDPHIFAVALERLGARRDGAVMIGNSLAADITGAARAGIRRIWVNRCGEACGDTRAYDLEITSLEQLPFLE